MTIRVLLADDHEMVRMGFALVLGRAEDITVVAECTDGVEAVEAARRLTPDVVLTDIRMPRIDGLQVCAQVSGFSRVVIVTTFAEDDYVDTALRNGASGFLLKDAGPELLLTAVRAAAQGDALISPQLTIGLLQRSRAAGATTLTETERSDLAGLSPREVEVLRLVALGRTNTEVAAELFISLSTVKTHVASIARQVNARNRVEMAALAWKSDLMR